MDTILQKTATKELVKFSIVLSLAIIFPFFHNQLITGPIVNALLFISVILFGFQRAVFIALIPSVIAMSVGLLPAVLAPMVPFIMMGNILLIWVFNLLKKRYWIGVAVGSFLKFLFLYASSYAVINLVIKKELAFKIVEIMSWPQLLTALAGGAIAYFVLKFIKK